MLIPPRSNCPCSIELERGDVSHWPRGLFRRAYLRDYAAAIGASSEPLVAEFVRLFPEDGTPVDESTAMSAPEPMRLTFPEVQHAASERAFTSIAGAAMELAGVVAAGIGLSYALGAGVMAACGATALIYYPLATAITGRTLSRPASSSGSWAGCVPAPRPDNAEEPATLYLVPRLAPAAPPLAPAPLVAVAAEDAPARHSAAV